MDFIKELYNLSNHITNYKDNVRTEQGTIDAFVKPFINALGYNPSIPTDVEPHYTADFGTRKGEKVDLAIFKDDKVIMLIECKPWDSDISKEVPQLSRYFAAVPEAKIGVLTNGDLYRFYTDLEKLNVMDPTPFLEFNMSEIQQCQDDDLIPLVNALKNFTKDNLDLEGARSTAMDSKYREEIKQILIKQLETPTEAFVEFFRNAIKPQMEEQNFRAVVKRAFKEFLDEEQTEETTEKETNGSNVTPGQTTRLKVTMPDGSVIRREHGKDTYIEVLEILGLEAVMRVCPDIVSTEPVPKWVQREKFWIKGANYGTEYKKRKLKEAARKLGVSLTVEQVEKNQSPDESPNLFASS